MVQCLKKCNCNLPFQIFFSFDSSVFNNGNNIHLSKGVLYIVGTNNKKYNCSKPTAFKSQRVGYPPNQKLLHHYKHSKKQQNS